MNIKISKLEPFHYSFWEKLFENTIVVKLILLEFSTKYILMFLEFLKNFKVVSVRSIERNRLGKVNSTNKPSKLPLAGGQIKLFVLRRIHFWKSNE